MTEPGQLSLLLQGFVEVLNEGYAVLLPGSTWLLYHLSGWYLLISLLSFFAEFRDRLHEAMLQLALSLMKFMLFAWMTLNWRDLCDRFAEICMGSGLAVGRNAVSMQEFLNIGRTIGLGWRTMDPMVSHWQTLSSIWRVVPALGEVILFSFAILICLISFALIGLQIAVAILEFKILSVFGMVLLPFGLFSPLAWLAESTVKGMMASAVRLGMLAVILGIVIPVINRLGVADGVTPTYWMALNSAAGSVLILLASWKAPAFAASILGGAAAMVAGDLIALGAGMGYMGGRAGRMVVRVMRQGPSQPWARPVPATP